MSKKPGIYFPGKKITSQEHIFEIKTAAVLHDHRRISAITLSQQLYYSTPD